MLNSIYQHGVGAVFMFVLCLQSVSHAQTVDESGLLSAVATCDRLAADPYDPEARADGVPNEVLLQQVEAARLACEQATDLVPGNRSHARLYYQLGRVYAALGEKGSALVQYQIAADLFHAGATTRLIAQALLNGVEDAQSLNEFAYQLAEAVAVGYQPASQLYLIVTESNTEPEAAEQPFDESIFNNPEVVLAAYTGDFERLAHWRTDDLLIDRIGVQGSLLLYVAGWEEAISQIWICPTLTSPALAAAAERVESEGLFDRLVDQPGSLIKDSFGLISHMANPEKEEKPGIRKRFKNIGHALVRNRERTENLRSQGRKDAVILKQYYGCESEVSQQMAAHLDQYFQ